MPRLDTSVWPPGGSARPPGGGSSGPLRPHPDSSRAAANAPNRARRRQAGRFTGDSRIAATIADRVEISPLSAAGRNAFPPLLLQPLEPALGLRAHVLRRGAAVAHPTRDRTLDREHVEHGLGDARLDLLHVGEQ